jgi:hypothetical protein
VLRADSCHTLPLGKQFALQPIVESKEFAKELSDCDRNMAETQRKFKERGYKNGQINTDIKKILNKDMISFMDSLAEISILTTCYSKCSEQIKGIVQTLAHSKIR